MESQIATTKEQSARLLKCGVPAESADMVYNEVTGLEVNVGKTMPGGYAPAWSLSALLGLLPKEIKVDESPYDEVQKYGLLIYPCYDCWQVDYQYCEDDECHSLICVYDIDLIETCVKAIEKLTAQGYALNGIEKGGEE